MSRKSNSFNQLFDYLMRDNPDICFSRNLYASAYARQALLKEFRYNASFLKNARGRNVLYHEMLALAPNDLSQEEQQRILREPTEAYIDLRAKGHLVFGVMHQDKEHMHMHLMISANEIEGSRRKRLSKAEFASMQKAVEAYKNEKYPELDSNHYQSQKSPEKSKQSEQEMKHRRKKPTLKERMRNLLKESFAKAYDFQQFQNQLKEQDFEFYQRGKTTGILHKGKKYRLKTLGLEHEYRALFKKFEQHQKAQQKREARRSEAKHQRSQTRTQQRRDELRRMNREKGHHSESEFER